MKNKIIFKIIFAMLLAVTVNSFVYISFANIYSAPLINYKTFVEQYTTGIYQYRFLSVDLFCWIHDFLEQHPFDFKMKLVFLDASAERNAFLSYFILNSFFLALTSLVMVLITEGKNFIATQSEKILIIAAGLIPIWISQFVLVPYDCSSYFFLLLFFWVLLKYIEKDQPWKMGILMIILIISTLNRESAALSISLAATLLYSFFGIQKRSIVPVVVLAVVFTAVYFSLRIIFGSFKTNDGSLLWLNLTHPRGWIGMLFWIIFFVFSLIIANGPRQKKNILVFHLFSLPYILMCFYTGSLYEIRLYVPIFLTSLFLGKIETKTALI